MTEGTEVTVADHAGRERFEALVGEHVAGWITYGRDGDVGQKVRPTCPFVKSFIEGHEEYADLVG